MIWIISYIIPILLMSISIWTDMKKGQTVAEYLDEGNGFFDEDKLIPLTVLVFIPIINFLTLFVSVPILVFNLVKNIRK